MITVFLRGGLGNQMFQYALGLNLAKKNNTDVVFDTVYLRDRFPRPHFSYRTFDLDAFTLEPRLTLLSRAANAMPVSGVWLGIDIAMVGGQILFGHKKLVREQKDAFDPAVLDERGNLLLYGRWQSENYFKDVESEIRAAFRLRAPFEGEAVELAEKIAGSNSVSLHVRRGDYAAFANVVKVMGGTNLEYYARAAGYIAERVIKPHFFVFSDDIDWCRANIKLPFPTTYVDDASRGPKASWHMMLMAQCKHNIITNSTFSWWGAWLNTNPGKIVVVPKRWFADPTIEEEVVPERWIKM